MTVAIIGRWGRSLAVRLPADISEEMGLAEGQGVDIIPRGAEMVIRKTVPPVTLEDLFGGKSPAEWRALYAGSYEWGPDQGREIVTE